jgi:hypothetical protein
MKYQFQTYKHKGNKTWQIKVQKPCERRIGTFKLPPKKVVDCKLGPKGDGYAYTVTFNSDEKIERLCNDAMRHAFKDHKIFQEIERTSEDEFVKNAYHSVLHDGIYLKRKLREFNGKTTRPHFYQKGKRISPKCITGGSIIQVVVQFKTYCFKGENGYIYGVRGELQKEIEIISLNDHISNKPPLPYIPFEI